MVETFQKESPDGGSHMCVEWLLQIHVFDNNLSMWCGHDMRILCREMLYPNICKVFLCGVAMTQGCSAWGGHDIQLLSMGRLYTHMSKDSLCGVDMKIKVIRGH